MLWERMLRAARLEVSLYEEVERDTEATSQALLVVVIVSLVSGIGNGLASGGTRLVSGLIFGLIAALVAWAVWSLVTYWVGTALFQGQATYGELLRCVGFAYTPNALAFFVFVPVLGGLIGLAAFVWSLVAMIIAVRQALDVTTGKAIATALIGWVIIAVAMALLAGLGLGLGRGMMGV